MMPIDFPVMVRNDQVAFSQKLMRGNYCTYPVDVEQLYTPYGFVVPMTNDSLDLIDFLEEGWANTAVHTRSPAALLIDHKGRIYELTIGNMSDSEPYGFSKLRVIPRMEEGYVRSRLSQDDQRARCVLSLTETMNQACALMNKSLETFGADYIYLDISEIIEKLERDGLTKPIPAHVRPKES